LVDVLLKQKKVWGINKYYFGLQFLLDAKKSCFIALKARVLKTA
jgi:hypothetical protein